MPRQAPLTVAQTAATMPPDAAELFCDLVKFGCLDDDTLTLMAEYSFSEPTKPFTPRMLVEALIGQELMRRYKDNPDRVGRILTDLDLFDYVSPVI